MAQYIHFTDEQKQRAAEVDLEEFLRRRGEKLLSSGRDKRLDSDHSVTIRGCEWFDHDSQQGGNAISFVRWFYHCSYPDAVKALLGDEQGAIYPSAAGREKPLQKPFELPEPNSNMRRVFAYLMKQRHIDRDVIAYASPLCRTKGAGGKHSMSFKEKYCIGEGRYRTAAKWRTGDNRGRWTYSSLR